MPKILPERVAAIAKRRSGSSEWIYDFDSAPFQNGRRHSDRLYDGKNQIFSFSDMVTTHWALPLWNLQAKQRHDD